MDVDDMFIWINRSLMYPEHRILGLSGYIRTMPKPLPRINPNGLSRSEEERCVCIEAL